MKRRITADFETRSACDLKKSGAYKYSLHPSTQPTCFAFKKHGKAKTYLMKFDLINTPWKKLPKKFLQRWQSWIDGGYEFSAHNAFFETCIYKNILVKRYGWPDISFRQFRCTAAKAATCALPRNLEGAGSAMNLSVQKDKNGYNAMMATCKPTKQWNAWKKACVEQMLGKKIGVRKLTLIEKGEPKQFLDYADAPETWNTLYRYCVIDVCAEEKLDDSLPDLIPAEQEIWFLNQRLNWNGLRVDIPTIEKVVGIMAIESRKKLKELDALTLGLVTKAGARKSILRFLELEDVKLPDIRAKTVEDSLSSFKLSDDARRLLEIRKALSKASTKKYQGFLDRVMSDGRCRDILLYHGASTGRDTGTGTIQPHNFPKGVMEVDEARPYAAVENVVKYDPDTLRMLYGDSLAMVFSSILRNMIVASPGYEMFVADFSKIEVAMLWWLADNGPGLEILISGKDPYIYQAAANLGKSYEEVERGVKSGEKWAIDARQLGKAQVLGCGYGMAWEKFQTSAYDGYRLKLTETQSKEAVENYRGANDSVVWLWYEYENATIEAIEQGKKVKAGKCTFYCKRGFLWIRLPSGRKLAYRKPRIMWRTRPFEVTEKHPVTGKKVRVTRISKPRKTIEYLGVDKSKKGMCWERTWGGKLTENIDQAISRDLMMPAMLRLEKAKYRPLLMVHDEGICERKKRRGDLKEFIRILCQRPAWADEKLPLAAKGWIGPRYRK